LLPIVNIIANIFHYLRRTYIAVGDKCLTSRVCGTPVCMCLLRTCSRYQWCMDRQE